MVGFIVVIVFVVVDNNFIVYNDVNVVVGCFFSC